MRNGNNYDHKNDVNIDQSNINLNDHLRFILTNSISDNERKNVKLILSEFIGKDLSDIKYGLYRFVNKTLRFQKVRSFFNANQVIENSIQPTLVSPDNLYFRFYQSIGRMSNDVVPMRITPHYRYAKAILLGSDDLLKEIKTYKTYTRWEGIALQRANPIHDENIFLSNIISWEKKFDLTRSLPSVIKFTKQDYFVKDGAHRIAYLMAKSDIGNQNLKIPVILEDALNLSHAPNKMKIMEISIPSNKLSIVTNT